MSASSDKLRVLYPEFESTSDYPDATVDIFIEEASLEMSAKVWGVLYQRGAIALAAHMMSVAARSKGAQDNTLVNSPGGVSQIKTGDEQITFGATGAPTASGWESSLRTTVYGMEYLRLQSQLVDRPFVFDGEGNLETFQ